MIRTVPLAVLLAAVAVGCESPMHEENLALHRQNRELQDKLDSANAQVRDSPDPAQYKLLQTELLGRDQTISELRNRPPEQVLVPATAQADKSGGGPASAFGDLETRVDARAGTVTVTLPGDVLFSAGQASLKPAARASLDKVAAAVRRQYAGRPIRVEGNTDADPIAKTRDAWTDNLELSLARAAAVSRYLEAQGIPPRLVTTSGFGANRPRGVNKARNRRVDIVVVTR